LDEKAFPIGRCPIPNQTLSQRMANYPRFSEKRVRSALHDMRDGKIFEEVGLDDGITALQQLGLIRSA
jgi:hypothetical protein